MNRLQVKIPAIPVTPAVIALSGCASIVISFLLYTDDLLLYLTNSKMCDTLYIDLIAGIATPSYLFGWLTIALTGVLCVQLYKTLQVRLKILREHNREAIFILLLLLALIVAALIGWSCHV